MVNIAYDTKYQDGLYIEDPVVGGIRAYAAQDQDQRQQDVLRNVPVQSP